MTIYNFHCQQCEFTVTTVKIFGMEKYAKNMTQDELSRCTLSNLALFHYTYSDLLYMY